ncbi:MAG: hypothetical protein SFV19_10730, partial [Rhodospirillaceae bacterium]|nr:hypothetical protein [Rhodospirillaceae bacterium]
KAFAAGIESQGKGNAVPVEFLGTCVDYIKASMDRLHAQDQRIHDILKPHVGRDDTAGNEILANLDMRLAKSRAALAQLVAGRDAYRAKGALGWKDFEATVAHFMDVYFNVLLKGQHSTIEMQKNLFGDKEWNDVAGVSQDALMTEGALFAAVKRLAPAGMDPESFKAGPPVV